MKGNNNNNIDLYNTEVIRLYLVNNIKFDINVEDIFYPSNELIHPDDEDGNIYKSMGYIYKNEDSCLDIFYNIKENQFECTGSTADFLNLYLQIINIKLTDI